MPNPDPKSGLNRARDRAETRLRRFFKMPLMYYWFQHTIYC